MKTNLTDAEVLQLLQQARELKEARANLEKYGTVLAPDDADGPKPKAKREVWKYDPKWDVLQRTCPQCGIKGTVSSTFGVKVTRGVENAQSWCRTCRSKTNYHRLGRSYATTATKKRGGRASPRRQFESDNDPENFTAPLEVTPIRRKLK